MKNLLLTLFFVMIFVTTSFAQPKISEPVIKQAVTTGRPTMVDFGASFCIPCKRMKPILDSLRKEYSGRVNVIFVDIKQERDMAEKYSIQLMPTQVFFDSRGKEVKRHMGFMDKDGIIAVFRELGVK